MQSPFPPPPVATMPPPAPQYPAAAAKTYTGLKMTGVTLVALIIIVVVAFTLPSSAAQARKLAYPLPVVSIQTSVSSNPHVGDSIQFTAHVTAGRDLTYAWDFGDGATAFTASASHSYSQFQQGGYDVHLVVTDPIHQAASADTTLTVLPQPPTAVFTVSQDPYAQYCFTFDASGSIGTQLSFTWDFGDGSGPNQGGETTDNCYYGPSGNYTVTLTVSDVANQTDSVSHAVYDPGFGF